MITARAQAAITSFLNRRIDRDSAPFNTMCAALSAWTRYLVFLDISHGRYADRSSLFIQEITRFHSSISPGHSVETSERAQERNRIGEIETEVHFEVEAFHLFSSVLLDRIASTTQYYFWRKSRWKHRTLADVLPATILKNGWTLPDERLPATATQLRDTLQAYRHTRIAHVEDPSLRLATTWDSTGSVAVLPQVWGGTPIANSPTPSGDIRASLVLIDKYVESVVALLDANEGCSILPPRERP